MEGKNPGVLKIGIILFISSPTEYHTKSRGGFWIGAMGRGAI